MKKIISLFQRNYDGDRLVRDEVVPGAEWVLAGEGVATRKFDGTCCMFRDGKLYKRYEVKPGKQPPADFEPANEVDEITGKQQGWRPVGDGPDDQYHREAWGCMTIEDVKDGTYELIGPKIQGNPEHSGIHRLVPHGQEHCDAPRTFEALKEWLPRSGYEGIVWWHPDGRMVKIKCKDFGLERLAQVAASHKEKEQE